jgi:hypothetical protein
VCSARGLRERVRGVSASALRAAAPWRPFAPRRGRLDEGPASSRSCARRALARGGGITSAHASFHLRDLQVLVELDGDQRAVGLRHVHLVHAVTGVGLDPVDGATATAFSAAARSVAAVALGTLFSSERTGWAPPGPGVPAAPLPADDAVLPPAADVLLADALSALARTPPLMTPTASRPTAPAHRFVRPRVFAESDMMISFLALAAKVAATAPPCLRHLSASSDRAMRCL